MATSLSAAFPNSLQIFSVFSVIMFWQIKVKSFLIFKDWDNLPNGVLIRAAQFLFHADKHILFITGEFCPRNRSIISINSVPIFIFPPKRFQKLGAKILPAGKLNPFSLMRNSFSAIQIGILSEYSLSATRREGWKIQGVPCLLNEVFWVLMSYRHQTCQPFKIQIAAHINFCAGKGSDKITEQLNRIALPVYHPECGQILVQLEARFFFKVSRRGLCRYCFWPLNLWPWYVPGNLPRCPRDRASRRNCRDPLFRRQAYRFVWLMGLVNIRVWIVAFQWAKLFPLCRAGNQPGQKRHFAFTHAALASTNVKICAFIIVLL